MSVNKKTGEEIYLIPELCYMTGLTDHMRDNFKIMREVNSIMLTDAPQKIKESLKLFDLILANS